MEKEIKKFIDYLTYIKHYSDKTTSSYFFDLKKGKKCYMSKLYGK